MNSKLIHFVILVVLSLVIAVICYFLGGQAATASGTRDGFSFKACGALAGFVISFVFLNWSYPKFGARMRPMRISVMPERGNFRRAGNTFSSTYTIKYQDSDKQKEFESTPIWAAGNLTVILREIGEDDLVRITIRDSQGGHWESDYFSPLSPSITLTDQKSHET